MASWVMAQLSYYNLWTKFFGSASYLEQINKINESGVFHY